MALPIAIGQTRKIVVQDTTFHIRVLSTLELEDFANKVQELRAVAPSVKTLIELLAQHIEHIDGFTEEPVDVLKKLHGATIFPEIISAIGAASNLSEDEAKNWNCSSAGLDRSQEGQASIQNVDQNVTPITASGSPTESY